MAPALCAPGELCPGLPPPLTNLPKPSPCREPQNLLTAYQGTELTLGFFTPLPLGCSSESCRFRGLFSAGGVSTKLESWGRGVAFSPKGSDWRRETSRVTIRASTLGVPVLQNPDALAPCSYSLETNRGCWDADRTLGSTPDATGLARRSVTFFFSIRWL